MSKAESFPVLTLTCEKTDYFDTTRRTDFYFEDWYVYQGLEIIKENCNFAICILIILLLGIVVLLSSMLEN